MIALLYIPKISAYLFMLLIVFLLLLIVVYIFHNVYALIFDRILLKPQNTILIPESGMITHRKRCRRCALPALRILITQELCYLACVNFSIANNSNRNIMVYFDRLSEIPVVEECTSHHDCDTSETVGVHSVIDTLGKKFKIEGSMAILPVSVSTTERASEISHLIVVNKIAAQNYSLPTFHGKPQRSDADLD